MSETITWPPTDQDFLRLAESAATHLAKKKFTSVLVYADNPTIMIFDPVHFSPAPRLVREYTATSETGKHPFSVIISEVD